jgi:hypothetical protein
MTIENDDFRGLSQFSDAFGFRNLATRLSQLRESGFFHNPKPESILQAVPA